MDREARILYVDDDDLARSAFLRAITAVGFSVELAESASHALRILETTSFDVIVSDLRMPGMDGLTFFEHARSSGTKAAFVLTSGVPEIDLNGLERPFAVVPKPWKPRELQRTVRQALEHRDESAISLLIIEDNAADAELLRMHLESRNSLRTELVEAETLEDALECMAHRPFDVILTDLGLPDENGIEVVERLRRASNEAAVIVTSGNEDEELAVRAIAVGAQDFLVKSFLEPMQLRRAIRFAIERKRTELRLAHLAGTDELTGLINRGTLTKRIVETLSRTRRSKTEFGVIYIDLDGFKPVNDRLGHKAGDELLCRVAHRMRGVVREYDACSRIGGDEFAVLIETPCNQDDAIAITNRLVDALNEPFVLSGGASVTIGASAGLAMHPQMGATPDRLLHAADQAMYRAKHAGGGRCMVAGYSSLAPASLESRLRSAVALENLELHFQPIVQCADGQLTAVEALLRWHPTADESIPPSVFVPLLEETGLINDVGSWIIDETLRQLSRWHRLGAHSLRAHVNVSPQQFENGELIENVRDSLERHSVAAQCLELEITESTLMQNTRASNATLSALKDLGLRLAIDDFGTGYSSLAYLHRFRVDTLKVDRAFVDDLGRSAHADAITSAILSLAQQLELEVVAEGIETPEQLSFVRQLRCPFAQGYLFAKPAPGAIIDAWIARGPESIVVPQQL